MHEETEGIVYEAGIADTFLSVIVYYVPRRIMRVITRRAIMLEGDPSRDVAEISPASILS